ncbi:MAG: protein translocase subunit SecF [Candidatus Pacebacteria bacterium CG10_big_fil_rev_8_21_14_0_10_36_11]|nr:MAG: protein translocase subunit SecF [Candidatus Pacebacteria bacterium CG10_big_fil_rev_8_21_14_0_10_36_11]PJC42515.1 MAG: protein translocase subunit SecF [Candidatus Pacebacteria bacterium CG_4_9_14_0_2_um_filter_36_8]
MKFMKWRWLYFLISAIVIIPGVYSLFVNGLRPAIDFTGGALLEIKMAQQNITEEQWISLAGEELALQSVQKSGNDGYILRGKPVTEEIKEVFVQKAFQEFGTGEVVRFETVGPILGQELIQKMFAAGVIVIIFILFYVARQFSDISFGVSAILAMFHDSLVVVGGFSLLGFFYGVEVDVLFVTALLTTLSFSVHDTIVVFDRIRELHRKYPRYDFEDMANRAVSETLVRSLNNSITIVMMLLALVLLGGGSIKWFSVALLIGAVTGTYSSTFTAVPLLVEWNKRRKK